MAKGRLLGGALAALGLAYASVLTFAWNAGYVLPSWAAVDGLEAHPETVLAEAISVFRGNGAALGDIAADELTSTLARAPLEEEPFTLIASGRVASGDIAAAENLLRIATRRNPRSRDARAQLLELLALRGNVRETVEQIEVLYRLLPSQRTVLRDTLVYLASFPQTRQEAIAAISDDGHKRDVVRGLAQAGASASMILETLETFGDFDLGADPHAFQAAITRPLLDAGDWRGALRLWSVFNPGALDDAPLLRDPRFAGAYPPPFGWEVRSDRNGYAVLSTSGLEGEAYGRRRSLLARQYTILDPGSYRLTVESQLPGRGLQIELTCPDTGTIAEERLVDRVQEIAFNVPERCAIVELGFYSRPTDPPVPSAFRVIRLSLDRTDSP